MLLVAVHGGAGDHPFDKDSEAELKKGLVEACKSAQDSFRDNQDVCLAVRDSIITLENDIHFNAGTGSNLTMDGTVECDASIMNCNEDFGAVGAISGFKNPIVAAHAVLSESKVDDPHGRIAPMMIAGPSSGRSLARVDQSTMISPKAQSEWKHWKSVIQPGEPAQSLDSTLPQDTVGAVACSIDGDVSAGVSSGGILLKRPGRVGEAGMFGAGCWASGVEENLSAIACSISGAGEPIMRAFLAKELAEAVCQPDADVHEQIERALIKFQDMCARRGSDPPSAGAILIVAEREDGAIKPRLWCGFTTRSFAVAYAASVDSAPKATILRRLGMKDDKSGLYITSLPL